MDHPPIILEDHFQPGFKSSPSILVGSQSSEFIRGNPEEQAWEGFYLGAARPTDVVIVRDFDPNYLAYWKSLMGEHEIINLKNEDPGEFLTQIILNNKELQNKILEKAQVDSKLLVFFPTELEQQLSSTLQIPLHGNHEISTKHGVKSGGRILGNKAGIPIPPGFICTSLSEIKNAVIELGKSFDTLVLKHDLSFSGYFMKRIKSDDLANLESNINEICGGKFTKGKDVIVVEGWLKTKASLCAHIEIGIGQEPLICAAWQQLIDSDGVSYMGAGPLRLSAKAFSSFMSNLQLFAKELKKEGAVGSFAPDFVITADEEERVEPDSAVLVELNARIPYTAVPLEIIKDVKGKIGSGFLSKHIKVKPGTKFLEIAKILSENNLLITKKNSNASGVVPYNVGLLPWGIFDIVVMADSWDEVQLIVKKIDSTFQLN